MARVGWHWRRLGTWRLLLCGATRLEHWTTQGPCHLPWPNARPTRPDAPGALVTTAPAFHASLQCCISSRAAGVAQHRGRYTADDGVCPPARRRPGAGAALAPPPP